MHTIVLLFVLAAFPFQKDLPVVRTGDTVQGTIEDGDPVVHTEILDEGYIQAPTLGKRYIIKIEEPGAYTFDLKSVLFDTYLVLRNTAEDVLAEDDDGLYGTHSRIVFESTQRESVYSLEACALHGARGDYELCLAKGHLPELSPLEKQSAALRDAREKVRIIEVREGEESPVLASVLTNLATLFYTQGQYDEARPLCERALRIREKVLGSEHPQTATSLNNLALQLYMQGHYDEARRLCERALRIRERVLGPEHPQTVTNLGNLALVLSSQGHYDEARRLYERALRINEQILGPEHPQTAATLHDLATLIYHQHQYDEARRLCERALRIRDKVLGPEHPDTAATLNSLAALLRDQGHYDEARPLYERALRIREQVLGPEHPGTAATLHSLAILLEDQGHYEEARPLCERALRIREQVLGPEDPGTAATLNSLAILLKNQGHYDEARPLFERALRIEQIRRPEHPETATILSNLAILLQSQGHYDQAKPLLKRVLRIKEQVLGPDNVSTAITLANLANLFHTQGQYDEARPLFERALRINEQVLGPEHRETAITLNGLIKLFSDLENLKEAWALSQRAIASCESSLEKLIWSLSEHERFLYARQKLNTLKLHLSLSRFLPSIDAEKTAYETLLCWKGLVSRSVLQSKERLMQKLSPQAREMLGRLKGIQSQLSKELYTTEIKDRALHEDRVEKLRKERSEMENELARLAGRALDESEPSLTEIKAALPDGSKILDFFVHEWYEPAVIEGEKVVKKGQWTSPHLSVWIFGKDDDHLKHIDLGPAEPIQKAVAAFLDALVSPRGTSHEDVEGATPLQVANERLYTLIWKPIAEHVQGANSIFISPDTFLGAFPFEVIQERDRTYLIKHYAFVYLQDMGDLVRLAGQVKERRKPAESRVPPSLLVVGDVDYQQRGGLAWRKNKEMQSPEGMTEENAFNLLARAEVQRSFSSSWDRLQGTEQEYRTIMQLHESIFEDKADRLVLRGKEATEERLKAELPGFDVVHLATHGFFNPEGLPSMVEQADREAEMVMGLTPERKRLTAGMLPGFLSGLVLSGVGSPLDHGREDGFLTAEELTWLDLFQVDLVVLSACETGLGTPRAGEGLIGLNRSLRQAGAEAVISSLWKVDDHATQQMFAEFYRHLWIDKMGAAEALRQAKLDMLRGKILPEKEGKERGFEKPLRKVQDYKHPYYWASFVYWGAADLR